MPTTSTGEAVYADPAAVEEFVQTQPENFGLGTIGTPSEWREFLESRQVDAKAHIDEFCGRDFEDHASDTVTLDGAGGETAIYAPSPIRSVSEVRTDGTTLDSVSWVAKPSGMLVRSRGEWPGGYQNVEVTMDWGYESPPGDVALAEKKLVDHTLVGLAQKREGMVVDAGDVSARINLPISMNSEVRRLLEDYQRKRVTI